MIGAADDPSPLRVSDHDPLVVMFRIGPPSPIRENDKLVAIEGESAAELGAKLFFLQEG